MAEENNKPNQENIDWSKDNLGNGTWSFFHTMASSYPHKPSTTQKLLMKAMIKGLIAFYPCVHCREDLAEDVKKNPIRVESRVALSYWLCQRHNTVNKKIGKKVIDCKDIWKRWNYDVKYEEGKEFVEDPDGCYGCFNLFGKGNYEKMRRKHDNL